MQVTAPTELNGCNVSYWWQSGHPAREQFGLLLTQSGHRPLQSRNQFCSEGSFSSHVLTPVSISAASA